MNNDGQQSKWKEICLRKHTLTHIYELECTEFWFIKQSLILISVFDQNSIGEKKTYGFFV